MKTAIETNHLSHAFGGRPVLDRVSLMIAAGDFFVIIGPNGSGKTTLMKLMCGILNTGPGRIA
ncbi:MAG: ABC transporter ATP-binding protein, partial [Desulfobacterales bacterium]|nr:ABC transporter ATP-binding protein [Desulfobacterales bacterium]